MTRRPVGMTFREIAAREGLTVYQVTVLISNVLRKLQREGLIRTARELAIELERNRSTENTIVVRRGPRSGQQ